MSLYIDDLKFFKLLSSRCLYNAVIVNINGTAWFLCGKRGNGVEICSGALCYDEFTQRPLGAVWLELQSPTKRCYTSGDKNGNDDSTF
jgi:hypothetical protein